MGKALKTRAKPGEMETPPGWVRGRERAAAALGVSGECLRLWIGRGAPGPRESSGGRGLLYPVDEIRAWHSERVAADMLSGASDRAEVSGDLAAAIYRKTLAEAQLKELDLAVRQGRFVPSEDVQRAVIQAARMFVAVLERAAAELAGILAGHAEREFAGLIQAWGNARRIELLEQIHGKRGD